MVTMLDLKAEFAKLTLLRGRTPQMTGGSGRRVEAFATSAPFRDGNIFSAKFAGDGAWEHHPNGDELVQIIDGSATLHIIAGGRSEILRGERRDARHRAPGHVAPLPRPGGRAA